MYPKDFLVYLIGMWIVPVSDSNFPAIFLTLRRNGVTIIVNKKVQWHFQTFQIKPLNITVIQVYAPNINAEEAEFERFYEDLQDLLELTPKTNVLFSIGD